MEVEKRVDYMQFTSDKPFATRDGKYELKKSPMANYTVMRVLPSGFQSHHGHNKSDKWLNVMSGSVCERIPDQLSFVQNVLKNGGTFSRIDYAITVNDGMTIDRFRQLSRENRFTGALSESERKSIVNDKTHKDETSYIGDPQKRSKRGIFRAYDKAVQLNIEHLKLTRFELEERQKRAQTTAKRFASGMDIGDIVRQRVDCDDEQWIEMCGSKSDKLMRFSEDDESEDDKTWTWLLEVVAKSLGRKIAEEMYNKKSAENFNKFNEIVSIAYADKMNELLYTNRISEDDEVYIVDLE